MWWQRKPGRKLSASTAEKSLPRVVWAGTLIVALALPLLAASLAVLLLGDRLLSRRLPWLRSA
jgi:uncharacterized iron-regulated membrane protein